MVHEEKEIKVLLTKEEYEMIQSLFSFKKPYVQSNYYYGHENIDTRITIRIRKKNDLKLQIKIPVCINGSLHIKEEYEGAIDEIYDILPFEKVKNIYDVGVDSDLYLLGKLCTNRRVCTLFPDIEIALDMNEYLGKIDYELEIEYKGGYPTQVIDILESENIFLKGNTKGKKTRFMEQLQEGCACKRENKGEWMQGYDK